MWPARTLAACENTIQRYQKLIKAGEPAGWENYGSRECTLCEASVKGSRIMPYNCYACPLGKAQRRSWKFSPCWTKTGHRLRMAIEALPSSEDYIVASKKLRAVAKKRLAWLKKEFKKSGIVIPARRAS